MKIAMIMSTPFPPEEGIGFHVYNLSKNLIEKGHKVTVITRGSLKFETDIFEDINIIRVPFIKLYPFHVYIHGILLNKLFKDIEKDFNIVHLHNPLIPLIKTKLPVITTMHGSIVEHVASMELIDLKSFFSRILGRTVSYAISKNLMKSSNKVVVISESVDEQIKKYYNFDNFEIIYNGVNTYKFYPNEFEDNYILYVGRLGHGKGIFDLLKAAEMLTKDTNIKLLIAGKGELEGKISSILKNEGLTNVKLLGHVKQEDLINLYQNAKIFVFPSHYEGLPTVILEAMASGLPIVTTSVSGCKDLINDGYNGLLVPPEDPGKLYDAIFRLLNEPELCEYLGKNARSTAENVYSWNIIADKIEIAYKNILNRNMGVSK